MKISVVIPTCNRKKKLLSLLQCLKTSRQLLHEIIIVDSGEDHPVSTEIEIYYPLNIRYIFSEKSVCIQRNTGIKIASGDWIFLCDDDIEVPPDYLSKLSSYILKNPQAGAVSGLVLQKENNEWVGSYPVTSKSLLIWKYLFAGNIWGPIKIWHKNIFINGIINYYAKKGNHISKSGWPVLTNFEGDNFETPVYGLGAALIKKEWLQKAPFDEVLDRHGIGDNYGVALHLPGTIQVFTPAFVYHHREEKNRLRYRLVYYRRALALDYFRKTVPSLKFVKKSWLLWSLTGNFLFFIVTAQWKMIKPAWKIIFVLAFKNNPYLVSKMNNAKIAEPVL